MVRIREIFTSIQGEGPLIGYKQLFIRFCNCNLNCKYCDTDFDIRKSEDYQPNELIKICEQHTDCHSVSLTGGEPLTEVDFLADFLPMCTMPIYLETNGTLYKELEKIIEYVDIISSDIKLPSSTGLKPDWDAHEKFFSIASEKELFAKVVFDKNITDFEIAKVCSLCAKNNIELILQPMMISNEFGVNKDFMLETLNKCLKFYKAVRLIPQVHKFLEIE